MIYMYMWHVIYYYDIHVHVACNAEIYPSVHYTDMLQFSLYTHFKAVSLIVTVSPVLVIVDICKPIVIVIDNLVLIYIYTYL